MPVSGHNTTSSITWESTARFPADPGRGQRDAGLAHLCRFAHHLITIARKLYHKEVLALKLKNTGYTLDAATIDLCLPGRQRGLPISKHCSICVGISRALSISDGILHEVNVPDMIPLETNSCYSSVFVIRAKSNLKCRRLFSHPVDKSNGVVCDQSILLTIPNSTGKLSREAPSG